MSMTAVEPTGINVAGKVALYFVPAIANTAAPKLTEMNAVASCNISRVVYAWDPNGSQGVTERSHYGSEFAGTMLGRAKYDPAELEYDDDPQGAGVAAEYAHLGKLTPGLTGYLVDRRGIHIDTALAAGDLAAARDAYRRASPVLRAQMLPGSDLLQRLDRLQEALHAS